MLPTIAVVYKTPAYTLKYTIDSAPKPVLGALILPPRLFLLQFSAKKISLAAADCWLLAASGNRATLHTPHTTHHTRACM